MNRIYTDVSDFRAPYDSVPFAGAERWPAKRSYWDVSNFRAPYDDGFFQDNSLWGMGAEPIPPGLVAPPPMPAAPTPTWVVVAGGVAAVAALAGLAYLVSRTAPGFEGGVGVGH